MTKDTPTTILIAEDHAISRSGLEVLINVTGRFRIIAQEHDGPNVVPSVMQHTPDILILDLGLPGLGGLMVLEKLSKLNKRPKVLVFSGIASGMDFQRALNLGADAIVSKADSGDEVLNALDAVMLNKSYVSASVTATLEPLQITEDLPLTPREKEVLIEIANGRNSDEIARQLNISLGTVKKHRENLSRKLGVSSAVEATRIALKLGLTHIT